MVENSSKEEIVLEDKQTEEIRYFFFDIECSNGYDICSFGYVLTDQNLNILQKEDIIINPESDFILGRWGQTPEITFAYQKLDFLKAPVYPQCHARIMQLLQQPNQIILGHSVDNDFKFLICACKRYNLEFANFEFFDTQSIYARTQGDTAQRSLENIAKELDIQTQVFLHKSDDDALMVKEIFEKLCKNSNKSPKEFLKEFEIYKGFAYQDTITVYEENFAKVYKSFINSYVPTSTNELLLKNKKVLFSPSFLHSDVGRFWALHEISLDNGANYNCSISSADFFVWDENKDCELFQKMKGNNLFVGKRLTMQEYCNLLKLTWDSIPKKQIRQQRLVYNTKKKSSKSENEQPKPTTATLESFFNQKDKGKLERLMDKLGK